eukprot:TRINITY_DN828_c0_g1_i2.p1 TRINITY_DN828_c0_g1~~TRINITY_DN828_c0_g1_i2.p1  ORF type:complete len:146 (-),score=19.44 TRINITY_DN828_c0_g1_i2:244-681(-)
MGDYIDNITTFKQVLQDEKNLQEIVQLVGKESLGEEQKVSLEVAKLIRNHFLAQNAFTPYDYMCPLHKTSGMLKVICKFYHCCMEMVNATNDRKMTYSRIKGHLEKEIIRITSMKNFEPSLPEEEVTTALNKLHEDISKKFRSFE